MTVAKTAAEPLVFNESGFHAFISAMDEPDWLLALRSKAWQQFQSMNWPSREQEDWMRSDLRGFKLDRYRWASTAAGKSISNQSLSEGVELAGKIETENGCVIQEEVDESLARQGVIFGDLSRIASIQPELVKEFLFSVVETDADRFAALHAACWHGGQILYVPKGVRVEHPFYVASGMTDGGVDLGHTLIVLDEGAQATFLYEATSSDPNANGLHVGAVEIVLRPGAELRYVNLQDWGSGTWHFAHQRAIVDRDASLQWTIAALGSRFAQVSQRVSLVGSDARSQVNGVLFTQGKQQLTYNTLQHHEAPHCRSDFLYKAALQDDSRTVWRGMIKVDPAAIRTDGYQRNDNLLLSPNARADSIPGLEILTDDVRCTHGSTSGKVDEEQIFYARSRGFTRKEAVRMIVAGFFQQIFDRITLESVRVALGDAIARQVREYQ